MKLKEIGFLFGLATIGGLFLAAAIYHFVNKYRVQYVIIYIVAGFLFMNIISAITFIMKESFMFNRWKDLTYSYQYC